MQTSAALAAVALVIAAACGGDKTGSGSAEGYLLDMARIHGNAHEVAEGIESPRFEDDATTEEIKQTLINHLEFVHEENRKFLADIERLDPPEEVTTEHARYIAAMRPALAASEQFLAEIRESDSRADLGEVFSGDDPTEDLVFEALQACSAIQAIANAREVEIQLYCSQLY